MKVQADAFVLWGRGESLRGPKTLNPQNLFPQNDGSPQLQG